MAHQQDKGLRLSLESLEGRNLTTSLGAAASVASVALSPPAEVSTNLAQSTIATHNYEVQTGFFMR
jgi:hypothetical protein